VYEDLASPFARELRVGIAERTSSQTLTIPVEFSARGDEVAMSFTLEYDAARLSNPRVMLGEAAPPRSTLTYNLREKGRVGILVDSVNAMSSSAVSQRVIKVTFDLTGADEGEFAFALSGSLAPVSVSDAFGRGRSARTTGRAVTLAW
jgi:hypothetical protein